MISEHEVRIVRTLRLAAPGWLTAREIANRAQVSTRTSRQHLAHLDQIGALEVAQIHPGPRYRLAQQPTEAGQDHLEDVRRAGQMLGTGGAGQLDDVIDAMHNLLTAPTAGGAA